MGTKDRIKEKLNTKGDWDSTFQLMSWYDTEKVKNAKVMVVGTGALGNEVLKNLALMGVGNIFLVDFDIIEYSNLSRSVLFREKDSKDKRNKVDVAAERIKEINPNVKVHTVNGDILTDVGIGVFKRMNAIISCLDNRLARLWINRYAFWIGKSWIDGALGNMEGVMNVYSPNGTCYEGMMTKQEEEIVGKRYKCAFRAIRNLSQGRIPTTPITSSIIGSLQVQEALKMIHGYDKRILKKEFRYSAMFNDFMIYEKDLPKKDSINMSSDTYEPFYEAKELTNQSTFRETLDWVRNNTKISDPSIRLHHDLVLEIAVNEEEEAIPVVSSYLKLTEADLAGKGYEYNNVMFTKKVKDINQNFEQLDIKLLDAGVPPLHVLQIQSKESGDWIYIELTGDETNIVFK